MSKAQTNIFGYLLIEEVGLYAQWTDSGRQFSQATGYSQSGAIDWLSFQLANALVGNELNAPAIEVIGGHFSFVCSCQCLISITGAPAEIRVNKIVVSQNRPLVLNDGDKVSIKQLKGGLFNYIAFAANVELPLFKGSACAVKRENIGGTRANGSGFVKGDSFKLQLSPRFYLPRRNTRAFDYLEKPFSPLIEKLIAQQYAPVKNLPILFSYQHHSFSNLDKRRLLAHPYKVTAKLDNMGVRLAGPSLDTQSRVLTSQPMANGSIQIPGDGQAIIMRNNRQTIGGYPVIGVVSRVGLAILSQARANDQVNFCLTDFQTAIISKGFIDIQLKRVLNDSIGFFAALRKAV